MSAEQGMSGDDLRQALLDAEVERSEVARSHNGRSRLTQRQVVALADEVLSLQAIAEAAEMTLKYPGLAGPHVGLDAALEFRRRRTESEPSGSIGDWAG